MANLDRASEVGKQTLRARDCRLDLKIRNQARKGT